MRLTAVSRAGELAPSLYRNHPLCGASCGGGGSVCALRRRGWGSAVGCRRLCRGGVFSSRVLAW